MLINPISYSFNVNYVKRNELHRHTPVLNNNLPQDTVSFSGAWSQLTKEELKLKNRLFHLIYNKNQDIAQDAIQKLGIKMPEDEAGKIALVKEEKGEYPILLLDDVLSELDQNRQSDLIHALDHVQLFITATEIPPFVEEHLPDHSVICLP